MCVTEITGWVTEILDVSVWVTEMTGRICVGDRNNWMYMCVSQKPNLQVSKYD